MFVIHLLHAIIKYNIQNLKYIINLLYVIEIKLYLF